MGTEIDRLEIALEVEASKASKQLSNLQKRLKELSSILSGINISDALGVDGIEKDKQKIESVDKSVKKVQKSYETFLKSISGIGKNLKFEGNFNQLQSEISKTEKSLERLWNREQKYQLIGVNLDTEKWRGLQLEIEKTSNYLQNLYSQYDKLSEERLKFFQSLPIDRGVSSSIGDGTRRNATVSPDSMKYDQDAMRAVFGETFGDIKNWQQAIDELGVQASSVFNGASDAAEEFEATIKKSRLSSEEFEAALEDLEIPEIDETNLKKLQATLDRTESKIKKLTAQQANDIRLGAHIDSDGIRRLSRQIVELSKYADALKDKISEIGEASPRQSKFDKLVSSSKSLSKSFSNLRKSAGTFGKQVEKVFGRFLSLIKKSGSGISNLIKKSSELARKITGIGTGNKAGKNFGIGKMLGTSLLFSGVFQAIGAIKSAVQEGSDNLVQYSTQHNASISSMVSALYTLKNAFAVAFSPIINVVAPYITAFINMLNAALNKVGQFFAAFTGKKFATQAVGVTKDYAAGLVDVGKNAGGASDALKDLNKAISILAFDEINKLQDISNTGTGSGESGNGLGDLSPSDMFQDMLVDDAIKEFADKLKAAWKKADFSDIGKILGDKINSALENIPWNKIKNTVRKIGKSLATFLNGSIETINWNQFGNTISQGLNTAFEAANAFVQNFHFDSLGKAIGNGINGIVNGIDWPLIYDTFTYFVSGINDIIENISSTVNWVNLGSAIGTGFDVILESVNNFLARMKETKLGENFAELLNGMMDKVSFSDIADILLNGFEGLLNQLDQFVNTFDWNKLSEDISDGLQKIINNPEGWSKAGRTLNNLIKQLLSTFGKVVSETDWEGLGRDIGTFLSEIEWSKYIGTAVNIIIDVLGGLLEGMAETPVGRWALALGAAIIAIDLTPNIISLVNSIGSIITGDQSYSILKTAFNSLFKNSTTEATTALSGLDGAMSSTKGWMQTLADSTVWTVGIYETFKQTIGQLQQGISMTDYTALFTALGRLQDDGSLADEQFNVLYSTLLSAQEKAVPFNEALSGIKTELENAGISSEDFKNTLSDVLDQLGYSSKEKAEIIGTNIGTGLAGGINSSKKSAVEAMKDAANSIIEAVRNRFDTHSPSVVMYNIGQNVMQGLENGMESKGDEAERTADGIGSRIKKSFDSSLDTVGKNLNARYKTLFEQGQQAGRNIESAFSSIHPKIPYIMIDWSSINFANLSFSIPRFKLTWFAKGGFPNAGELFMANEKGPEMIGKMGNRNVVANNKQITDGIKNAVVEGMVEVMMMNSTNQGKNATVVDTHLYLDGHEIARSVKKAIDDDNYRHNPCPVY